MTNAELLAKIREEIERRRSLLTQHSKLTYDLILETFIKEYDDLLSFLDTIESEKPMNLDELVKEAQRYYSDNFAYITSDQPTLSILTNIARHFAKWGAEHEKEELMKKAVEGEIVATAIGHLRIVAEANEKSGVKDGDKVRIIIVKEN